MLALAFAVQHHTTLSAPERAAEIMGYNFAYGLAPLLVLAIVALMQEAPRVSGKRQG